jgi:5-methylcytosine-specific restriction protein A
MQGRRPSARQRGYDSRWEKEREAFLKANPLCVMCLPIVTPAAVVDHIVPHKGDQALFWSRDNWQALCATHHNAFKQRQEHGNAQAIGLDGWPIP